MLIIYIYYDMIHCCTF